MPGMLKMVSTMIDATDQRRQEVRRERDQRDQAVAQHVPVEHVAFADALGAGGADVIGVDVLQHRARASFDTNANPP